MFFEAGFFVFNILLQLSVKCQRVSVVSRFILPMIRPIEPLFGKVLAKNAKALDFVKLKIAYADHEVRLFDQGKVYIQYYGNYLYYMEVWEIHLDSDAVLPFEILDFSLFLFFMLEGAVFFTNSEEIVMEEAEEATCYATINTPGRFHLHLSKGKHILTYACPRLDWLMRHQDSFPLLIDFIGKSQVLFAESAYLKKMDINRSIGKCLFNLWQYSSKDDVDLEFELGKLFKRLIKSYYDSLEEEGKLTLWTADEKIMAVNDFLKLYFHNPNICNVSSLCDKFLLTERTFSRVFYKVNKKNLAAYLTELRLIYACQLLRDKSLTVQKVSIMCGFRSFNYFTRVFTRRYLCCPREWRQSH